MLTLHPRESAAREETTSQSSISKPSDDTSLPKGYRQEANSINGRVADEKDKSIEGAEVSLFRINRITNERKLIGRKLTDTNGLFRFEKVIDVAKEFPDGKLWPLNTNDEEFVQVYVRKAGFATDSRTDLRQRVEDVILARRENAASDPIVAEA